jgi:carbamate kinase
MAKLVLVAVGGNALMRTGERGPAEHQFEHAIETASIVVELIKRNYRVVLTHGNGPQIGAALIRSEIAAGSAYRMPYDCCLAATQGEIGYVLQYALWQMMQKERLYIPIATLITQVRVEKSDPAFAHPTKPIGPYVTKEEAERYRRELGWTMVPHPQGYRRVVPSPEPKEIIELDAIRACVERGLVVIAGGGGGIPIFNDHDITKGVEAVIDKDLTSAILANQLHADIFAIATGEEFVYLDYGKPTQRAAAHLSLAEATRYLREGQFPEGSMGPKVYAAIRYIEHGGTDAIITNAPHLLESIEGRGGTHITATGSLPMSDADNEIPEQRNHKETIG